MAETFRRKKPDGFRTLRQAERRNISFFEQIVQRIHLIEPVDILRLCRLRPPDSVNGTAKRLHAFGIFASNIAHSDRQHC